MSQGDEGPDQVQITLDKRFFTSRDSSRRRALSQDTQDEESSFITIVVDIPKQVASA